VREIKDSATVLQSGPPDWQPGSRLLALSCPASKPLKFRRATWHSSGKGQTLSAEDWAQWSAPGNKAKWNEFIKLATYRREAEDVARRTRTLRNHSVLQNSKVRQPLREYQPLDLVKVWRKCWPHHRGLRGGHKLNFKPHWIGHGRAVTMEVKAGDHDSERKHIVWVIIDSNWPGRSSSRTRSRWSLSSVKMVQRSQTHRGYSWRKALQGFDSSVEASHTSQVQESHELHAYASHTR
jgi:hypothetical protein